MPTSQPAARGRLWILVPVIRCSHSLILRESPLFVLLFFCCCSVLRCRVLRLVIPLRLGLCVLYIDTYSRLIPLKPGHKPLTMRNAQGLRL